MFYLGCMLAILFLLIQAAIKSERLLLFFPVFFTVLLVIAVLFKLDFGRLTLPYVVFMIGLWSILVFKKKKITYV